MNIVRKDLRRLTKEVFFRLFMQARRAREWRMKRFELSQEREASRSVRNCQGGRFVRRMRKVDPVLRRNCQERETSGSLTTSRNLNSAGRKVVREMGSMYNLAKLNHRRPAFRTPAYLSSIIMHILQSTPMHYALCKISLILAAPDLGPTKNQCIRMDMHY